MKRLMRAIRPGVWVAAVAMLVTGGIVAAPATTAMAASGCVTGNLTIGSQGQCVIDAQVLLNNIRNDEYPHLPYDLVVDGSYGPLTAADVQQFQKDMNIVFGAGTLQVDSQLGIHTWWYLCEENSFFGFQGVYWHNAGCATEGPNPPA